MLLQDEQYIVHWLTQYGPLPQTQIVSLLRHKPPEVAAKIIRGLKRQQMIFDIAGGYYLGVDPMGQPDQRIIHAVWVLLQFADKVEPMAHYSRMGAVRCRLSDMQSPKSCSHPLWRSPPSFGWCHPDE